MGKSNYPMKKILIAGGTGFIGSLLVKKLRERGHEPAILTRNPIKTDEIGMFYWDVYKGEIQADALKNVDVLINLAGENVSAGRWTKEQKQKIIFSRINSTRILFDAIKNSGSKPEAYISSSATGFYGISNPDKIYTESDPHGNDFLAYVCKDWEEEASKIQTLGIRTCILRTGVVFGKESGAFPKLTQTLRFGFISALGSGRQFMPWIHADDLANMYLFAAENPQIKGTFNAVAPQHISQTDLIQKIRLLSVKGSKFLIFRNLLLKLFLVR
jgi:uncharacterized protein (TIGR01777 family)